MSDHRSTSCIVLIGPAAAGKSTVGPLVAEGLGTEFVDLDAVAGYAYEQSGQPLPAFRTRIAEVGYPAAHRWWQQARVHAVVRVLDSAKGAVVALGAGHSHYEDAAHFESVQSLLSGHVVVLLLPDPDEDQSLEVLRRRSVASKGHDWTRDGLDYLKAWVASIQNRELADHVVYTGEAGPEEVAARILDAVNGTG